VSFLQSVRQPFGQSGSADFSGGTHIIIWNPKKSQRLALLVVKQIACSRISIALLPDRSRYGKPLALL
jgi:hypothetical protein